MRGLGFAVSLFFSLLAGLGYLAFDFTLSNRAARAMGEEEIGFGAYVKGWVGLSSILARGDAAGAPMPGELLAMLPKPPEGWQARPVEAADTAPFLTADLDKEQAALVRDALEENRGKGLDQARQAYQSGPSVVAFELVRYPDGIFTSFMAMATKMELEMRTAAIPAQDFMSVRGLEVREVRLPEGAPARAFVADIAAQMHLRVTAPAAMGDDELRAFFETLHVPAMNAAVARPVKGMGEVPLIVLASAIDDNTRAAREAERAAAAEAAAEAQAAEAAAEAETQADEAEAGAEAPGDGAAVEGIGTTEDGATVERSTGEDDQGATVEAEEDGVKVTRGTGKAKAKERSLGGECRTENGRKACGVGGDEAAE